MEFKKLILVVLSISVALFALITYGFIPLGNAVHPEMKKIFNNHKIGIYMHVFFSMISLALGPF